MDNDSVPKQIHDCALERERTMRRTLLALLAIMAVLMIILMGVTVNANSRLVSQAEIHAQEIERLAADNSIGHPQPQLPLDGDLGEEPGRPNPDEGFTPPPGEVTLTELLGDNAPDINSGVGSNGAWAEANDGETRCAAYAPIKAVEEAAFFVALDYFATSEEGMARVAFPEEFIRGGGYCHTVDETRECVRLYVYGDIVIGDIVRCPEPEE